MEPKLAKHVAAVAIRSSTQMTSLVPLLKEKCQADEYKLYAKAIASAVGHINSDVLELVFAEYPDVKKEVEDDIAKYGIVL